MIVFYTNEDWSRYVKNDNITIPIDSIRVITKGGRIHSILKWKRGLSQSPDHGVHLTLRMEIPRTGFGTFQLEEPLDDAIFYAFEEAGYKHLDCAECYGNEVEVGQSLKKLWARGKVKREDVFIVSKIWNSHHKPEDVETYLRLCLKNLQLDYLDLYLIHWPCAFLPGGCKIDRSLNVLDMWPEMQRMVELGLCKRIGVSNFSIELLEKMRFDPRITIQPYCNQVELNLYMQQEAMRQYCEFRDIKLVGFSTMGSGMWEQNGNPNLLADEVLNAVAKEVGKPVGSVEQKFLLQLSPLTVVLVKSKTPSRIKENIDMDFTLSEDQMNRLKGQERCFRCISSIQMWGIDVFCDGW